MKYTVQYSMFARQYLVVNTETGLSQSGWALQKDALIVARDLNRS